MKMAAVVQLMAALLLGRHARSIAGYSFQQGFVGVGTWNGPDHVYQGSTVTCESRVLDPVSGSYTQVNGIVVYNGGEISPSKCGGAFSPDGSTMLQTFISEYFVTVTNMGTATNNNPNWLASELLISAASGGVTIQHTVSVVFDTDNTMLFGAPDLGLALRYPVAVAEGSGTGFKSTSYTPISTYNLAGASHQTISGFLDLAADGDTIYYTSAQGDKVLQYSIAYATVEVWLTFADAAAAPPVTTDIGFAIKLLPQLLPLTGKQAMMLVVHYVDIQLLATDGTTLLHYAAAGETIWSGLALDTDGLSFWSVGRLTDKLYRFTILTGALVRSYSMGSPGGYTAGKGPMNPMVLMEPTARLSAACVVPCCQTCAVGDPTTCAVFNIDCLDGTNLLSNGQYRGCPHQYLDIPTSARCGGDRDGCCQANFNVPTTPQPTAEPVTVESGNPVIPTAYLNCNNPFIAEEPAYCKSALWEPWDCPTFRCQDDDSCVCNQGDCTCQTAQNAANLVGNANQIVLPIGPFNPSNTLRHAYIQLFCATLGICGSY